MTTEREKQFSLPARLRDIDPSWDESAGPLSLIGKARLVKGSHGRYEVLESSGVGNSLFSVSKQYLEQRGLYGDEMFCFFVEYSTEAGRRMEMIPAPFDEKLLAQSKARLEKVRSGNQK